MLTILHLFLFKTHVLAISLGSENYQGVFKVFRYVFGRYELFLTSEREKSRFCLSEYFSVVWVNRVISRSGTYAH